MPREQNDRSTFVARFDGNCSRCGDPVVGSEHSDDGKGSPFHWKKGVKGVFWHCAPGCCDCKNPWPGGTLAKSGELQTETETAPGAGDGNGESDGGGGPDAGSGSAGDSGQGGADAGEAAGQGSDPIDDATEAISGDDGSSEGPEWDFDATAASGAHPQDIDDLIDVDTDDPLQSAMIQALKKPLSQAMSRNNQTLLAAMQQALSQFAADMEGDDGTAEAIERLESKIEQIEGQRSQADEDMVDDLKQRVGDLLSKIESDGSPVQIEVERPSRNGSEPETEDLGVAHFKFPKVVDLIRAGKVPYLAGPPGGGKSYVLEQLAKAFNLPMRGHVSLHPRSDPSVLLGLRYPDGKVYGTSFSKAIVEGGVVGIDELDNSSAEVQARINTGIAQHRWDLPQGMTREHDDCVILTMGNTNLRGTDWMFPERRPADVAFSDRLVFVDWPYDPKLERALTLARHAEAGEWLEWVRQVRAYVEANQIRLVVSPRASFHGADLLAYTDWGYDEIAESVLFKDFDEATVQTILGEHPLPENRPEPLSLDGGSDDGQEGE